MINQNLQRPGTIPSVATAFRSACCQGRKNMHPAMKKPVSPFVVVYRLLSNVCSLQADASGTTRNTPAGCDCLAATPPGFALGFRHEDCPASTQATLPDFRISTTHATTWAPGTNPGSGVLPALVIRITARFT